MTLASNKIESVQLLRAAAALGVVSFHAIHQLSALNGFNSAWSNLGAAGVDLFFVVSGFIMWVTALDRGMPVRRFAAKRIQRIVPLYWLTSAGVLAIVLLAPGLMRNASHDPLHFVASFAFIAWPHPALPGHFWPVLVPGWSLNYEMLFYLLVGASLMLPRLLRVPAIGSLLLATVVSGWVLRPTGILSFYTNPIMLEFLLGLLIGMSFSPKPRTRSIHYIFCLMGVALFAWAGRYETEANRLLTWGLPLAIVALGAVNITFQQRNAVVRTLSLIGDASYSIYLTQFIVLPAAAALIAHHILPGVRGALAAATFVAAVIVVAVLVGIGTFYLVEKPLLRASTDLLARNRRTDVRPTVAQW